MEEIKTKVCSKCHIEKPLTEFYNSKSGKLGVRADCKICCEEQRREHKLHPVEKIIHECPPGTKFCTKCKTIKPLNEFGTASSKSDPSRLRSYCKKCGVEYAKSYFETHKEQREEYRKEYSRKYRKTEHGKMVISTYMKEYRKYHVYPKRVYSEEEKEMRRIKARAVYRTKEGKERYRKRAIKYHSTPLGKLSRIRGKHVRRAKDKNLKNDLNLRQWNIILYDQQNNKCNECKKEFGGDLLPTADHIIPVSSIWCPGLTFGNTQALCGSCNSSKRDNFYLGRAIDEILVTEI